MKGVVSKRAVWLLVPYAIDSIGSFQKAKMIPGACDADLHFFHQQVDGDPIFASIDDSAFNGKRERMIRCFGFGHAATS